MRRISRSGDTLSKLSPNATKVYMWSGHSWPKGSVVPIFGMSPRQPLCQGSHMQALPGGECLMRAVDNVSKHCMLTKLIKQSLLPSSHSTMKELCDAADSRLFSEVLRNHHHILHHLLPPVRHNTHNMRQRSHNRVIPLIKSNTFTETFINRMLLKD